MSSSHLRSFEYSLTAQAIWLTTNQYSAPESSFAYDFPERLLYFHQLLINSKHNKLARSFSPRHARWLIRSEISIIKGYCLIFLHCIIISIEEGRFTWFYCRIYAIFGQQKGSFGPSKLSFDAGKPSFGPSKPSFGAGKQWKNEKENIKYRYISSEQQTLYH